jgi:hypothetical protein
MEIAMFLPMAAGQISLCSYWLMAGIWAFPTCISTPFRITQRLLNSIWAFPSGFPISFWQCPAASNSGYQLKHGYFHPFCL